MDATRGQGRQDRRGHRRGCTQLLLLQLLLLNGPEPLFFHLPFLLDSLQIQPLVLNLQLLLKAQLLLEKARRGLRRLRRGRKRRLKHPRHTARKDTTASTIGSGAEEWRSASGGRGIRSSCKCRLGLEPLLLLTDASKVPKLAHQFPGCHVGRLRN